MPWIRNLSGLPSGLHPHTKETGLGFGTSATEEQGQQNEDASRLQNPTYPTCYMLVMQKGKATKHVEIFLKKTIFSAEVVRQTGRTTLTPLMLHGGVLRRRASKWEGDGGDGRVITWDHFSIL